MNMGYCKFENTLIALRQCARWDEEVTGSEAKAKQSLIELMIDILNGEGYEIDQVESDDDYPDGRDMTIF